jgi:hypothetical protein
MKMLLTYEERQIARICPKSLPASVIRLHLAKLRLKRELNKVFCNFINTKRNG